MVLINSAQPELLALAEAVRGEEFADGLGAALQAARNAGWDWPRTGLFASRLIFTPDARPWDLANAARKPTDRAGGDPDAYGRGASLARGLLATKEETP